MNKTEFLKKIDELDLDKNNYTIIASGVMLMYGLRDEVSDVDLKVTKETFDELMNKYAMKQSDRYDYVYELLDGYDINCRNFNRDNIEYVDGYPVEKIELQLKWKKEQNREKDQKDIEIIENYLKERGE